MKLGVLTAIYLSDIKMGLKLLPNPQHYLQRQVVSTKECYLFAIKFLGKEERACIKKKKGKTTRKKRELPEDHRE